MLQDKCYPKIAIDGPAGAGKSTVAREVARRLQIKYLDTGAMYRAITLKVIRENIDLNNSVALQEILSITDVQINEDNKVFLDGEEVTVEIRSPQVNKMVSPVSCISSVRRKMVTIQKAIVLQSKGIIMEGRDIASRVMPDADFKLFLDASVEERARRRMKEQRDKGIMMSALEVTREIAARDRIDSTREDSPLIVVPEAIVIDTTAMAFEEVVDDIIRIVREGLSCSGNG
ncbi:MAG: (d)CMP kinase [Bacillota bacterium]